MWYSVAIQHPQHKQPVNVKLLKPVRYIYSAVGLIHLAQPTLNVREMIVDDVDVLNCWSPTLRCWRHIARRFPSLTGPSSSTHHEG